MMAMNDYAQETSMQTAHEHDITMRNRDNDPMHGIREESDESAFVSEILRSDVRVRLEPARHI
jgi:hypothetical protein